MISSELKLVADTLMQRGDVAPLIEEAGSQMQLMRKKQKKMERGAGDLLTTVLPKSLAVILPLVNHYYDDRRGWMEFIRFVRDTGPWGPASLEWKRLHDIMRTENSNWVQYRRRFFSGVAADLKDKTYGNAPPGERTVYMTAVQKMWSGQLDYLNKQARLSTKENRLPQDLQMEVSDRFWDKVEADLNAGKFPEFHGDD